VASEPVLHPGTDELDANETAVTALTVAANGAVTTSAFSLRAGVTYRLVVTGAAQYDPTGNGDADCTSTGGAPAALTPRGTPVSAPPTGIIGVGGWGEGSRHAPSPAAPATVDTRGLLVNGALRWEGDCQPDHTYEAWFRPDTKQRLQLQYADPTAGDNTGTFTVYVARDDITRSSLAK
jgi:hypothetical protein